MAFLGNFINDIVKLPDKATNMLGKLMNDAKSTIQTFTPKVGEFIRDVPGNITRTVDTGIDFALKQANKLVDLNVGAIVKYGGAAGVALQKVGEPLLNNPILGGVALAGSGSALLFGGAALIATIFILKKF